MIINSQHQHNEFMQNRNSRIFKDLHSSPIQPKPFSRTFPGLETRGKVSSTFNDFPDGTRTLTVILAESSW